MICTAFILHLLVKMSIGFGESGENPHKSHDSDRAGQIHPLAQAAFTSPAAGPRRP